jgi:hypothetical protein
MLAFLLCWPWWHLLLLLVFLLLQMLLHATTFAIHDAPLFSATVAGSLLLLACAGNSIITGISAADAVLKIIGVPAVLC